MGRLAGMLRLTAALWAAALWAAALWAAPAAAQAPTVSDIRIVEDGEVTRVVVDVDRPIDYAIFSLAQQGARIVLDLEPVGFAIEGEPIGAGQRRGAGNGLVAAYRFAQFSPERSRIVLDLQGPALVTGHSQLPAAEGGGHRLAIALAPASMEDFVASAGFPVQRVRAPALDAQEPSASAPVIVLDPGHGGDDPGAIGARGALEKDVNLAIALAIREQLLATGRYHVVMTREEDRGVPLDERLRIARDPDLEADLLLSIHADAAKGDRSLRGASVYTLAEHAKPRSSEEILALDPRIGDIDLRQYDPVVGEIVVDFSQNGALSASWTIAEALIRQLRAVGPLLPNTHRRDDLYVLLAPDVPSVLIEAGFVTNPEDEARLTSDAERRAIAAAVVEGVESYFAQRERLYAGG